MNIKNCLYNMSVEKFKRVQLSAMTDRYPMGTIQHCDQRVILHINDRFTQLIHDPIVTNLNMVGSVTFGVKKSIFVQGMLKLILDSENKWTGIYLTNLESIFNMLVI